MKKILLLITFIVGIPLIAKLWPSAPEPVKLQEDEADLLNFPTEVHPLSPEERASCQSIILKNGVTRPDCKMRIPRIFHRIWFVWDPENPHLPPLYKKYDEILKKLHPAWEFKEWNEEQFLAFLKTHEPHFLETYLSYDVPVKRHDAARYLLLKHYGGVFIQHSFHLQKNLEPLLEGSGFVIAQQKGSELNMAFMGSTPHHPFLDKVIATLPLSKDRPVVKATGPNFVTQVMEAYLAETHDTTVAILDKKYLYPFNWKEKNKEPILSKCIQNHRECFSLFPESYGYTIWKGAWAAQKKT